MSELITTLGAKSADEMGMILPHEHIFVDLRTWDQPGYSQAEAIDVINLMAPEIERARSAGITAIVECSPVGVGRRADILKAVSQATEYPLVVPTGVYREPWIPPWIHAVAEEELYEWMLGELQGEIEGSGVQAAWIKLSAGDDGITPTETKVLRAAARAAAATNAVIGSHTIRGHVVRDQLAIIESVGYTAERFIWVHTQAEPDRDIHLEIARRGAWIEYDSIGSEDPDDDTYVELVRHALEAGLGDHVLLSHDRGWFDPAQPNGGAPSAFTYITDVFLPKLRGVGVDDIALRQLTQVNPFRAFAR